MQKSNQILNFFFILTPVLCNFAMRSSHGASWAAAPQGGLHSDALDISFAMMPLG